MNIMFLDDNPHKAAEYHADGDIYKHMIDCLLMIQHANGEGVDPHVANHDMTKWVCSDLSHYLWVYIHMNALLSEGQSRQLIEESPFEFEDVTGYLFNTTLPYKKWRNPPRCIPDKYKVPFADFERSRGNREPMHDTSCHVASYRWYYTNDKRRVKTWTKREKPEWFADCEVAA
jgi:hypothetical protein